MLPNKPQEVVPPDYYQFGDDYEDHEDHFKDFNQNEEMQGMITTELVVRHMGQEKSLYSFYYMFINLIYSSRYQVFCLNFIFTSSKGRVGSYSYSYS